MSRRIAWAVVVVSAAYLAGWTACEINRDRDMAETLKSLQTDAERCLARGNYRDAFDLCNEIEKRKGGSELAHRLRGKAFEQQGKLIEAEAEYQAAYSNGGEHAHVASVSLMRVKRKLKGGG